MASPQVMSGPRNSVECVLKPRDTPYTFRSPLIVCGAESVIVSGPRKSDDRGWRLAMVLKRYRSAAIAAVASPRSVSGPRKSASCAWGIAADCVWASGLRRLCLGGRANPLTVRSPMIMDGASPQVALGVGILLNNPKHRDTS